MLKRLLLNILLFLSFAAFAQDESDTSAINNLREYPKKNTLPVRRPVLQLQTVELPASKLDIEVNYWRNWFTLGINMNQASFSDNWKGGGVNSIAIGSTLNYKTDYTKENVNYVSEVILQYGKIKNKDQLQRKSTDRIFWDNKISLKISKRWNFYGSLNFESQFDRGFRYDQVEENGVKVEKTTTISRFMSPGYLTESIGFEYKPERYFWLRIGTGAARQTFVLDRDLWKKTNNQKNYGVDTGKVVKNELAFVLESSYEREIMQNISLKSRYRMFASYEKLNNIDQRLDLTLIAKVNKLVNVTFTGVGLYDDDADAKVQASQAIALGLIYRFPN